jgi:hypothetical protein
MALRTLQILTHLNFHFKIVNETEFRKVMNLKDSTFQQIVIALCREINLFRKLEQEPIVDVVEDQNQFSAFLIEFLRNQGTK